MLPPGQVYYYFTVDDKCYVNEDQPQVLTENNALEGLKISKLPEMLRNNPKMNPQEALRISKLNVPKTNVIKNIIQEKGEFTSKKEQLKDLLRPKMN